jgi:hypothetical protein
MAGTAIVHRYVRQAVVLAPTINLREKFEPPFARSQLRRRSRDWVQKEGPSVSEATRGTGKTRARTGATGNDKLGVQLAYYGWRPNSGQGRRK